MEIKSERISLKDTGDIRFLPKDYLAKWADDGFIVTKSARDVWQYVQNTLADPTHVGAYLAGPMGVGKSSIMYYVVHKAREEGWLVTYIPRCDKWLQQGYPSKADWYSYLFDAVRTGLNYVKSKRVKKTFNFCIPPNGHPSWSEATLAENLSLGHFQRLFRLFRQKLEVEVKIPVLLAFDESQALFESGIKIKVDAPFSLIDWSSYYQRGCVFVTSTADSPYIRSLSCGHERYILNTGCLLDDEFALWMETGQFDKILKHPEFKPECLPEITSVTGNIPRELILLNEKYCDHSKRLSTVLKKYCGFRQAAYEARYQNLAKQYPRDVGSYLNVFMKFFTQIEVSGEDVPVQFFDTGLAYISEDSVVPLNSSALKCFFKLLTNSDEKALEHEIMKELHDLTDDIPAKVGYAFEKLFGLNLLHHKGVITLKYQSINGVDKHNRVIRIRHFLTLDTDKPRKSWKDYPLGTLVAHSESGEDRMDFIYFGGSDCVLFFELTVAKDVRKNKYPKLSNDSRLNLILERMQKWFGHEITVRNPELMPHGDYKGAVEYIVVSSRTHDNDCKLFPGNRKKELFPWIKVMDRNDLGSFFPKAHIEKLASIKSDKKSLKRKREE
jgi:Mitochondrial ribosomal death-associated protein 3